MKKEKFRVGEGISEQISKNRRNVKEKKTFYAVVRIRNPEK